MPEQHIKNVLQNTTRNQNIQQAADTLNLTIEQYLQKLNTKLNQIIQNAQTAINITPQTLTKILTSNQILNSTQANGKTQQFNAQQTHTQLLNLPEHTAPHYAYLKPPESQNHQQQKWLKRIQNYYGPITIILKQNKLTTATMSFGDLEAINADDTTTPYNNPLDAANIALPYNPQNPQTHPLAWTFGAGIYQYFPEEWELKTTKQNPNTDIENITLYDTGTEYVEIHILNTQLTTQHIQTINIPQNSQDPTWYQHIQKLLQKPQNQHIKTNHAHSIEPPPKPTPKPTKKLKITKYHWPKTTPQNQKANPFSNTQR